jgi:hypothetical protein
MLTFPHLRQQQQQQGRQVAPCRLPLLQLGRDWVPAAVEAVLLGGRSWGRMAIRPLVTLAAPTARPTAPQRRSSLQPLHMMQLALLALTLPPVP